MWGVGYVNLHASDVVFIQIAYSKCHIMRQKTVSAHPSPIPRCNPYHGACVKGGGGEEGCMYSVLCSQASRVTDTPKGGN